jgi:hypothetical protein
LPDIVVEPEDTVCPYVLKALQLLRFPAFAAADLVDAASKVECLGGQVVIDPFENVTASAECFLEADI